MRLRTLCRIGSQTVLLVGSLALAGYVVVRVAGTHGSLDMLAWFGGAVIGHDLLLFPLYALADRGLVVLLRRPTIARRLPLSPINHIRIPTLGALLLFCVYFPGIVTQGSSTYIDATGQTQDPFLQRWLVTVAAMYAIGAAVYATQIAARRRRLNTRVDSERSSGGVTRTGRRR